jgi:L-alanine-DL-glutamate epimerase-like enolase superfamily enzyme
MTGELRIVRVEARPLDVPLIDPFVIASTRLDRVRNVAVRVELSDGSVGWGEASTLPPVTAEDQPAALAAVEAQVAWLTGRDADGWRSMAGELAERMRGTPSARAGLEMAVIDAVARSRDVPLYRFFGGATDRVTTDITIPIGGPDEAERLAARYRGQGFATIKTKVGLDVDADIARLVAIRGAHPDCSLVLDANEGYTAEQALDVVRELRDAGMEPALLEQPVAREDWDGLGRVARDAGVPVAADESCRDSSDARRIARDGLAQVLNMKLVKSGVVDALEIAEVARAAGLGLMIGGMVETRIAMGFSAHLAAGLGGFDWIDLDTPLLLAEDPVRGGYRVDGATYYLDAIDAGHGGELDW